MAKETYYFSHDANARNDEKILMLRAEHGWEGYGIYWALVEMMFESSETALHNNKIKGIAVSYNIDITVLESVINTCITEELFVTDDVKFWSESLKRRKGKYQEMKEKKAEAGRKGMAKRWGKDNSVITDDNTTNNSVITENNKGKESKVNKSKEKDYTTQIKNLFSRYPLDIQNLITTYWNVVKKTRKSGEISQSVIYKTMEQWDKYHQTVVKYSLKTHIDNYGADRDEKYTLGIMRRTTPEEASDKLDKKLTTNKQKYEPNKQPTRNDAHIEKMRKLWGE